MIRFWILVIKRKIRFRIQESADLDFPKKTHPSSVVIPFRSENYLGIISG